MSRLIDAEKLKAHYAWWDDDERRTLFDQIVDAQPGVDAVEVIWCAECYFWDKEPSQTAMPEVHTCRYWRIGTTCVDYCARASRDGWLKAIPKENATALAKNDRKDIDEEIERAWEYAKAD